MDKVKDIQDTIERHRQMLNQMIADLEPQLERVISVDIVNELERIYLVGCGDSYFASLGVRMFFEKYTGIPTEPSTSMQFSRYLVDYIPENSLVIGVSNGGRVSRTIEAIIRARKRRVYTIAATGYTDRRLAHEADAAIIGNLPNVRETMDALNKAIEKGELSRNDLRLSKPGAADRLAESLGIGGGPRLVFLSLAAYLASIVTLYLIGFRIAELRGALKVKEAIDLKQELLRFTEVLYRTTLANTSKAKALAETFQSQDTFLILGSGPSYATALVSAAKLFELPQLNGVPQDLEEWAHQQFFFTRPDKSVIFVIVPPGNSRDRAIEQIKAMKTLGATVIAVCDANDREILALVDEAMPVKGEMLEEFTPLVYIVPGQLFAFSSLHLRGQPPIPPPLDFQKLMEINYQQIYQSDIWED
jgi:glucosamine 6-phosphate synthetase-like amidotransferase/phosphosugar isomerase protein